MKLTLDKAISSISHNGIEYPVQKGVVELPDDVYSELREQLESFVAKGKNQAPQEDGEEAK